jgi:hypothetical protein
MSLGLPLHEALLVIALRANGTPHPCALPLALGAGLLGELLLGGWLTGREEGEVLWIEPTERPGKPSDALLAEALQRIRRSPRARTNHEWLAELSAVPRLIERVADRLRVHRVLGLDERRVLGLFRRRRFPVLDTPARERVVAVSRRALLDPSAPVEPRTALLLAIAHRASLLGAFLSSREIVATRGRLLELTGGQHLSVALPPAILSFQTASFVGTMIAASLAAR